MSDRPGISVVTLSFNQAPFLERALLSVLAQQGGRIEYIVVDAGSTDGSRDIIARYRHRLAQVILEPDQGPADGLNKGLARATGDIFYYLNADDEVCPGALAQAADVFARRPQIDVVYGNGLIIDGQDRVLRPAFSAARVTGPLCALGLAVVVQQATFFRTSALRQIGGFNIENRTCWDGEALLDIALNRGRFLRLWRTWGRFRLHDRSITGTGRLVAAYRQDQLRMARRAGIDPASVRGRLCKALLYLCTRATDLRRLTAAVQALAVRAYRQ